MEHLPCTLLIPAAGESIRFAAVGYKKPKGLIKFNWLGQRRTMIEHCVPTDWNSPVRIVCKEADLEAFAKDLPWDYQLFRISVTLGQADTIRQSVRDITSDILVINSDNGFSVRGSTSSVNPIHNFIAHCRALDANLGAVVFKSHSEQRYGYVDNHPEFTCGVEKVPISNYALAGAFYFKNTTLIEQAYAALSSEESAKEIYLSSLFRLVPVPKIAYLIERAQLHEWGTPAALAEDKSVTDVEGITT